MEKEKQTLAELQNKYRLVKDQIELGYGAVSDRLKILPQIAALSATLLIIATFNKDLIPITNSVKFLLTVLLILIPVSLYLYVEDLLIVEKKSKENIVEHMGQEFLDDSLRNKTLKMMLIAYFPHTAIYILFVVVFWICALIWSIDFTDILSCN